jgi:DNA topoisomerase I
MAERKRTSWWRRVGDPADGFRYLNAGGEPLEGDAALARIQSLSIPPAWTDVHIAPDGKRRIQAWGRDAKGRKQYIYSPAHVVARDRRKWGRVLRYAGVLPRLRAETNRHLSRDSLDREKVLATVVRLTARAYFRVGSERYAVQNRTFGICTLDKRHLEIRGSDLVFRYVGKGNIHQRRVVADTPLVEIIEQLLQLPGPRLFQYLDEDGSLRHVTAGAVNRYLQEILGERYSSKDLRTFGGTVRAATILADLGAAATKREARANVVLCCRLVAADLGNTAAICRSAYIHPAVLEQYEKRGRTIEPLMRRAPRPIPALEPEPYYPEEAALMRFLERHG